MESKKPIITYDRTDHIIYTCECGELLRVEHKAGTFRGLKKNYCCNCGCKIDWSRDD